MQTHDWDAIREALEAAHDDGHGDWVTVAEGVKDHALTQRIRGARIPTLEGLDLEAQSRRVYVDDDTTRTTLTVYARIKRAEE